MDEEFDEIEFLEAMDLIDRRNELLNELEAYNSNIVHLSDDEITQIQDELNNIYSQLNFLNY